MFNDYTPIDGDAFICSSDSYEKILMFITYKNDKGELYACSYEPGKPGVPSKRVDFAVSHLKGPFFPSFLGYALKGRSLKQLDEKLKVFQLVTEALDKLLLNTQSKSILISDAIGGIAAKEKLEPSKISVILKLLFAEAISYKYKNIKSGEYIQFSDLKTSSENSKLYYGTLAEEIALKSKQISLLISHGQTVGNYRELILRSLLEKYLPSKFSVVTGFIEGISRQFDILIIDSHNYSPVFKEGELVVARKESVRAIIEVKTNLDSQKLNESLELFYDITRGGIFKPQLPIFKGVFAFDSNYSSTNALTKKIKNFYTKPYFEEQLQYEITRDIDYLYREVTCVCVLKKHFVYTNYENFNGDKNNNVIPALKSVSDENDIDIQSAMFIASLFRYLDVDYYAKSSTLNGFLELLQTRSAIVEHEMYITESDWFPSLRSHNEHESTQESIQLRLSLLNEWFSGKITSSEYIKTLENDKEDKQDN